MNGMYGKDPHSARMKDAADRRQDYAGDPGIYPMGGTRHAFGPRKASLSPISVIIPGLAALAIVFLSLSGRL